MGYRDAYLYAKKQQEKRRKVAEITVRVVALLVLVLIIILIERGVENGERISIQKGTNCSVETGNSGNGARDPGAVEEAGSEGREGEGYGRAVGEGQTASKGVQGVIRLTDKEDTTTSYDSDSTVDPLLCTYRLSSLGEFKLTAYCACKECCGKDKDDPLYGITASGKKVKENHTVAADPSVLPIGTVIYINGSQYTVEDVGSAVKGRVIDIYIPKHEDATEFGVQYAEVFTEREVYLCTE